MEKQKWSLSHAQKRIFYIEKMNPESQMHNIGGCVRIFGKVNVIHLKQSMNIVLRENDAMRIRIIEEDGEVFQYIAKYEFEDVEFIDFSIYDDPRFESDKWLKETFSKKMELIDSKLYRFYICKITEKEYVYLYIIHHISGDGWTASLFENEINEVYSNLEEGNENFNDLGYSYYNYLENENRYFLSNRLEKDKKYWLEILKDVPEHNLYYSVRDNRGKRKSIFLSEKLEKLLKTALNEGNSLESIFLAAFYIVLNKKYEENDWIINLPVFNRSGHKMKKMMGMCTSTVPFRYAIDIEKTVDQIINEIKNERFTGIRHQMYPYDTLMSELNLNKEHCDSIFKYCINVYNSQYCGKMGDISTFVEEMYCGEQSYSLQIVIKTNTDDKIEVDCDYKIQEYSENEIDQLIKDMCKTVEVMLKNKNKKVKDLRIDTDEEINDRIYKFNDTKYDYPQKSIVELFEEQVEKTPDNIALEFEDEKVSYIELSCLINKMSEYLLNINVQPQTPVAVYQTHSIELIVSIFAILKIGAFYVPIDPQYPVERIKYITESSKCNLILSNFESSLADSVSSDCLVINIGDRKWLKFDGNVKDRISKTKIDFLAYVLYTSGSTGKPKGVMVEHKGLTNYICWANRMYIKSKNDSMAFYSSISFDLTITSIFTPLISGNRIIIYKNDEDEFVLYKILRENKATVIKLTPSHLLLIKKMDNTKSLIKRFIVGGEELKTNVAKDITDSFGGDIEIYNEYGPTETVVGCMIYKYDKEKDDSISVSIGKPASNVQIYIMDKNMNIVQGSNKGDIYISGDGVARGYIGNDKLTAERFIDNPFISGKKMYKTGDIGFYMPDGNIMYVGREDNQIKLRGHRIEISEIESRIENHEEVERAVVVLQGNKSKGQYLIAYIVLKNQNKELPDFKPFLSQFLPMYMIPSYFIKIDFIPVTVNGKTDTSKLPVIYEEETFIKPETELEKIVVSVLEEILEVDNIGLNNDYIQLGGDSIKAIQISAALSDKGYHIKVKDILGSSTIKEITKYVTLKNEKKAVTIDNACGDIGKTPISEWFFSQNLVNEGKYNQYVILDISENIEPNILSKVMQNIVQYHDSLRINVKNGNILFYNNEHLSVKELNIETVDLLLLDEDEQNKRIIEYCEAVQFDIEKNILFRVICFKVAENKIKLSFVAHHLVVDGVSWRIIIEDFAKGIIDAREGKEIKFTDKTNSLKEWAENAQKLVNNISEKEYDYWKIVSQKKNKFFEDCMMQIKEKQADNIINTVFDKELISEFTKCIRNNLKINENEAFMIALVETFSELTGEKDIKLEVETNGRDELTDKLEISRTIGWFTNIYPMFLEVKGIELKNKIRNLKEQIRSVPENGKNYGIIKYLSDEKINCSYSYIRFNYLGDYSSILKNDYLPITNLNYGLSKDEKNKLSALISFDVLKIGDTIRMTITFDDRYITLDFIRNVIVKFEKVLEDIKNEFQDNNDEQFTPSDFNVEGITLESWDDLFI